MRVEVNIMRTKQNLIGAMALILLGVGALPAGAGVVNVADVEELEAAVAAANAGGEDTEIVLTSPAPDYQYQLTQPLVITESGVTLRGAASIRPDLIEILGVPAPEYCPGDQIQDGQFEVPGNPGWNQTPDDLIIEDEDRAYSPTHFAEFAGETGLDGAVLEQSVIVPGGGQVLEQAINLPVIPAAGSTQVLEQIYRTQLIHEGLPHVVNFFYKVAQSGGDPRDKLTVYVRAIAFGIDIQVPVPLTAVGDVYQAAVPIPFLPPTGVGRISVTVRFVAELYNPLPGQDPTRILIDDVTLALASAPGTNLIPNNSFESGATNWVQSPVGLIENVGPQDARTGNWAVHFFRPVARLRFDLHVPEAGLPNERLIVSDADGMPLGEYSAADDTYRADYRPVPYIDLEPYSGDVFLLRFSSDIERGSQTVFLVDNVCIESPRLSLICGANRLLNGQFENGDDGAWLQSDLTGVPVIVPASPEHPAQSLPFLARFGAVDRAALVFWMRALQRSGLDADRLDLYLVDPAIDPNPAPVWSVTGANAPEDWEVEAIPMDEFAGTGRPVTIRFNASLARLPETEKSIFLLDDTCAGTLHDESCFGNLLGDSGFDWDDGSWTETPAFPKIISLPDDDARSDPGVARFEGQAADIQSLWQNINIDPESDRLRFYLKVEEWNEVAGADRFTVLLNNSPVLVVTPTAPDEEYTEYRVNVSDFADGAEHELRFESSTTRVPDKRTVFLLDDVCLPIAGMGLAPVIEVAEDTAFTLEGVSLIGGSTGLRALEGAEVTLRRCYIHDVSGPGVDVVRVADARIGHSVIFDCVGAGLQSSGSLLSVFQSTIIGNREGVKITGGKANVLACLLYRNNTGLINTSGETANAIGTLVQPVSIGGFDISGITTPPSGSLLPNEFFATGPWVGKLRLPVTTDAALIALDPVIREAVAGLGGLDFERETRGTPLQAGADEWGGGMMQGWLDCRVEPLIVLGERRVVPGPGRTFTVRALVENVNLAGARMIVKPQEMTVADLYDLQAQGQYSPLEAGVGAPFELVIDPADFSLRAQFTIPASFVPHPLRPGEELCLEGLATVYLWLNNELYGIGTTAPPRETEPYMFPEARTGSRFILDITPPLIDPARIGQALPAWFPVHNDNLMPPAAYEPYPVNWGPAMSALAASSGALAPAAADAHVFFNTGSLNLGPATEGLDFSLDAVFYDAPPRDSTGNLRTAITTSGFRAGVNLDSSSGLLTVPQVLFSRIRDENNIELTGLARWIDQGGGAFLNNENIVARTLLTPDMVFGERGLAARWQIQTPPAITELAWRLAVQFEASDLAGNMFTSDKDLNIWWMNYAQALLLDRPAGQEVSDPVFRWDIYRPGSVPANAAPCFPIVTCRLWQMNAAMNWEAVTAWSPWTPDRTIDRNTLMSTGGVRLGDWLDAPELSGKTLLITVAGADEAGNVQAPWPGNNQTTLNSVNDLETAGIEYGYWLNAGVLGRALDTQLQARFWLNTINAGELRERDPGEIDYGSSTRIPLPPPDACNQRIEAAFEIAMTAPDTYSLNQIQVAWQLFEDQREVASGIISSPTSRIVRLVIPEDLLNPQTNNLYNIDVVSLANFLNCPPPPCACPRPDRLGDDGDPNAEPVPYRARDVEYRFVAKTQTLDGISDSTPASIQFTVYASEDPGDEQPVKETTR